MISIQVAICGTGAGTASRTLRQAGHEPLWLVPGEGLAQARNAALAQCAADVLAFVDGDCLTGSDWLAALRRAWDEAPDGCATIGGPIRLEFGGARPRWLTDALLVTQAPFDLGGEAREIPAAEHTFRAGNVSFRADALRGAGGFWPMRGDLDQRDWFTDEHAVQRELHALGWTAHYEPALAVTRVVGRLRRRDVIRQRRRYGARLAAMAPEQRSPAVARKTALTAAAGLPASPRRSVERFARIAENLGFLRDDASADFQPVATSTPFLPSVPDPQPRTPTKPERGHAAVLLYHRIDDGPHHLGLSVSPENFASQIEALRDRIVPLEEILDAPPGSVAITFDDGYADNLHTAAPILDGLPWTLFVSTGHVEEGRRFWWDTVDRLLASGDGPLRIGDRAWPRGGEATRKHVSAWLQAQSNEEIERALEIIRAWSTAAGDDPRPLTVDELRELAARPGVSIGAHTRRHPSLRWCDEATRREEIERSRDDLAAWLGTAPTAFSYPFGVPARDVDDATVEATRAAGFTVGVVNSGRPIRGGEETLQVPRLFAPNVSGAELDEQLSAVVTA